MLVGTDRCKKSSMVTEDPTAAENTPCDETRTTLSAM
jgi:hypothetical protein